MVEERLQKVIARAGVSSRRGAEKLILDGRISINNQIVHQLGTKTDFQKDEIRLDGLLIRPSMEKIYIMLNKPRGYITTLRDPQQRPIVSDLLPLDLDRVFPVGRLDYDSQGLLLLTNDGDFAQSLTHPSFLISKEYQAKIKGKLSSSELKAMLNGVLLEDGIFIPEDIRLAKVNDKSTWLTLTLRSGKNRIIRRAFAAVGHNVVELVRIRIGNLELGDLKIGSYRFLKKAEVHGLISLSHKRQCVKKFLTNALK